MIFQPLGIEGAFLIRLEAHEDERGYFARTFSVEEFAAHGLETDVSQSSISKSLQIGTLRGMHYQAAPHGEAKLIRCLKGKIFDAAVDLRPTSETYAKAAWVELDDESLTSVYLPRGLAHGYLTLTEDAIVAYQMSAPYVAEAARGVRYDDPAFAIPWPAPVMVISERDKAYPDFKP